MSDDIMGHDWSEVRDERFGGSLSVISYVCQSCGHTEAATQIICRPGEGKHFEAKFGVDQVRESPYAALGPGEAYAIDGRTACTTYCTGASRSISVLPSPRGDRTAQPRPSA